MKIKGQCVCMSVIQIKHQEQDYDIRGRTLHIATVLYQALTTDVTLPIIQKCPLFGMAKILPVKMSFARIIFALAVKFCQVHTV